jgi:hypothetical protein
MTAITKQRLSYAVADSILNEIQSGNARYYYFIGGVNEDLTKDLSPSNTLEYEAETRRRAVVLKSIGVSDVCMVVPRINWLKGTVYEHYDSEKYELDTHNFYVLTLSTFNVYKCLFSPGTSSIDEPSGTGLDPFITSDGYKWKFLCNVPLGLRNKFLTVDYMPVASALRNRFFSDGCIESIIITNSGAGLTYNTMSVTLNGDGEGAELEPFIVDGQLVSINIINPGVGYTYGEIEIAIAPSQIGFVTFPAAYVNFSRGDMSTPQALVEGLSVRGSIDAVNIKNSGYNYTKADLIIIGDGEGATAQAVIATNGEIEKIVITDAGSGYTYASINIVGDGQDAMLQPIISPFLGHGRNVPAELNASTLMFYKNLNYEKFGGVPINNDFRQFGIIRNPRSAGSSTLLTDPVTEYSFAIYGNYDVSAFPVGTVLRTAELKQYRVSSIIISEKTEKSGIVLTEVNKEGIGITIGQSLVRNDIPSIGLVVGGVEKQRVIQNNVASPCYVIGCNFDQDYFPLDTVVVINGKQFVVVSTQPGKMLLSPRNGGKIHVSDTLNKLGTSLYIQVLSVVEPNVDIFSGDMLFIDNRDPFNQTIDQAVTFRSIIKF